MNAIKALQRAVKDDKDRFLFEMATGTGKTLTAAAVIKLFLRSGNANRELIERFEKKIQATIDRVWGGGLGASTIGVIGEVVAPELTPGNHYI